MKKNTLSKKTIALFIAAAILLAGGSITGTRAVLNIYSDDQLLGFRTSDQNVSIIENGTAVSGELLAGFKDKPITPGKKNAETIAAHNNSNVNQFVRIVVRKYWKNEKGEKVTDLKEEGGKYPELDMIRLDFAGGGWQKNDAETTPEREVYYYGSAVAPGRSTPALVTGLTLDSSITQAVNKTTDDAGTTTTYTYKYDGWQLCIEAQAQSVQTHNATDAIKSIWGVQNVSASETSLTVE